MKSDPFIITQVVLLVIGSLVAMYGFYAKSFIITIPGASILMIVIALNIVSRKNEGPLRILQNRLAKGEITREEFEELRKMLK